MKENILTNYAVVEDGIIINILVFDDAKTAKEFGCLPLSPNQGIGSVYISPEKYKAQENLQRLQEAIDEI